MTSVCGVPPELTGLTAMALMARDGMRSVVVVQFGVAAVKSEVCQMPPLTVAAKRCLLFIGSTANALTAPTSRLVAGVGPMRLSFVPATIGLGPTGVHVARPLRVTEGTVRTSIGSSRGRNL